jgi:acyl-CoA reductase-like NAD-dependent aldehyde dehydrogenase
MATRTMPSSPRPVESFDPNSGEVWARFEPASRESVAAAVAAARAVQKIWGEVPLRERAAAVERMRQAIYDRRETLAAVLSREIGKPAFEAIFEVILLADTAGWAAREGPRVLRSQRVRSRQIAALRKWFEVRWEPFGVVGVISPWNYPFLLTAGSLFPSLVAGNAVLVKPSERSTSSIMALVDAIRSAAGVPHDLVQMLPGDGSVGMSMIESGIDRLFFVGSEAAGRRVAAACGERLIPCSLELGGSDAAIVLEDADPAAAAAGLVWGRFSNAGQTCVAPKRVFAVGEMYDKLLEAMASELSSLRIGSGEDRDVGALIHPEQVRHLREQRDEALARGARIHARALPDSASPAAAAAEIIVGVDETMRLMTEETFGPILPVMRVATEEEAIEKANASSFGLSASVWTRDARRGVSVAQRLHAGSVMVNDVVAEAAMYEVSHGGWKGSGSGRMHGPSGLTAAAQSKTIVVDRFASWRQVWWFPYADRHKGLESFFDFLHGRGLLRRLAAGIRAVRVLYFPKR